MLRECLASLQASWPQLPRVRVITDGSLDPQRVKHQLAWWGGALEVISWQDLRAQLAEPRFATLLRFAERDAMGRKLAAIVASALDSPTLYCDVDFLWFRYPSTLADLLAGEGTRLVMSPDVQPMYDQALVPERLPHLATPPYYCAGLLFARGDFLAEADVTELLAFAAERGIGVTEQTILAEVDRQLGGDTWPTNEIALGEDDRFSLGPSFRRREWAGRHYVGQVRHLLWRDALALRLGLTP
jgi:hypothetical protein